ncbi:oxidoreductase, acting on superoxide radicals as acceptor [Balamuthia mandrillaris]
MSFTLPELPYPKDALAPHISEETLEFHYGKHHAGYVAKLNGLVKDTPNADKSLEELIRGSQGGLFNNAAQIWNHTFYWNSMSPEGGGEPTGAIAEAIVKNFGDFNSFKKEFSDVAGGHFGSGWAWLVQDAEGKLKVIGTHDAGNPITDNLRPILTCDVWEHAYYIDYRNARPNYINAWWNLVNWKFAESNLSQ